MRPGAVKRGRSRGVGTARAGRIWARQGCLAPAGLLGAGRTPSDVSCRSDWGSAGAGGPLARAGSVQPKGGGRRLWVAPTADGESVPPRHRANLPCAERRDRRVERRARASGGIGRRARFRSVCPKGRGGSTPPSRTTRSRRIPTVSRGSAASVVPDVQFAVHICRESIQVIPAVAASSQRPREGGLSMCRGKKHPKPFRCPQKAEARARMSAERRAVRHFEAAKGRKRTMW